MKTFVLSTVIAIVMAGNVLADQTAAPAPNRIGMREPVVSANRIDAFKSQIAFHQRNIEVLWNQYNEAIARIRNSRGNHAELARDQAFFVGVYERDISNGVRVEDSKRAIADIEAKYAKAHAKRDAYESLRIASLQVQLKAALKREAKAFKKVKRKNAELVNAEVLPLVEKLQQYIVQSIDRAENLVQDLNRHTVAAR